MFMNHSKLHDVNQAVLCLILPSNFNDNSMNSPHKVLLFGAGKSSSVLIEYLIRHTITGFWQVAIADADESLIRSKVGVESDVLVVAMNVDDELQRREWIEWSDLVISLMPPHLHLLIAKDCVQFGKSLLTASYVDDAMRELEPGIREKNLFFLCEMGLDPGIDHMSALELLHRLQENGAVIDSFVSHCGGLVAPESDDNPWHYKISWNPRNVVMAGKAGAIYRDHAQSVELPYQQLFGELRPVQITTPDIKLELAHYPNRNSLPYIQLYGLDDASRFIRTTLRYPAFMTGWNNLVQLKLTDETLFYETDGLTLMEFFKIHFETIGFNKWLDDQLAWRFQKSNALIQAIEASNNDEDKLTMSAQLAETMESANVLLKQLFFLGMEDAQTCINRGRCSAAEVLQFCLEHKLILNPTDQDMVVMQHEFQYQLQGKKFQTNSSLVVKGKDAIHTAMAKTVGLPLGIAAHLILDGKLNEVGLHIPTLPSIYKAVLPELEKEGICFHEQTNEMLD
jgi:saccharopine dehydrogenase-like NADP-dependent oxidoreductase